MCSPTLSSPKSMLILETIEDAYIAKGWWMRFLFWIAKYGCSYVLFCFSFYYLTAEKYGNSLSIIVSPCTLTKLRCQVGLMPQSPSSLFYENKQNSHSFLEVKGASSNFVWMWFDRSPLVMREENHPVISSCWVGWIQHLQPQHNPWALPSNEREPGHAEGKDVCLG